MPPRPAGPAGRPVPGRPRGGADRQRGQRQPAPLSEGGLQRLSGQTGQRRSAGGGGAEHPPQGAGTDQRGDSAVGYRQGHPHLRAGQAAGRPGDDGQRVRPAEIPAKDLRHFRVPLLCPHGRGALPGRPGAETRRAADAHRQGAHGLLPAAGGGGLRALFRREADGGAERDPHLYGAACQRGVPERPRGGKVL